MAQDKFGYIPPSIQRQMDSHMQQMPAHLQKYQNGNTYIPQKAAQEMAGYMKKSMPAHMQEYISPYMERKSQAGLNSLDPMTVRPAQERAPAPDLLRRGHSAFGEQFNVDASGKAPLSFSPQYSGQQSAPSPTPPPVSMAASQTPYDFIMQDPQQTSKKFGMGGSKKSLIIFGAIAGSVLLMLIIIVAALISSSGKGSSQSLIKLAQEQNEIIRVADLGAAKARTANARNLATITSYSFHSTQSDTVALLAKQGHKLKAKELGIRQNNNTDAQLNTADLNNKFDETFTQILTESLATYEKDVQEVSKAAKSKSEQQILTTSLKGVKLLVDSQAVQSN